jgi:hypothetical protein
MMPGVLQLSLRSNVVASLLVISIGTPGDDDHHDDDGDEIVQSRSAGKPQLCKKPPENVLLQGKEKKMT